MIKYYLYLTLFTLSIACQSHADSLIIEPDMGRTPLISAIQHANSSVDLVMYGFTDPSLMDTLKAAKNSGKNIRVILEKYPYKNTEENTAAINFMQHDHINLKWPNPDFKLTHEKSLIIDHKTACILTFNFTRATFKNERNFGLCIDDPTIVNEIQNTFDTDWNYQKNSGHHSNLVWSPDNSREKLLDFIQQAKSSIKIYAQSITDYQTIGALAHAAKNGVNVEIITSKKPEEKNKKYAYLTRAGVKIHFSTQYYIHAKVIIVDHQYAMLGSMNLTKESIDDNRELSVITQNKHIIQQLETLFSNDIAASSHTNKTNHRQSPTFNITQLVHHAHRLLAKFSKID